MSTVPFFAATRHCRKNGFALLEVIVATVIISVLAAGIFTLLSNSKSMSVRLQQKMIAASLVEAKMNELKNLGANKLIKVTPPATEQLTEPKLPGGTLTTTIEVPEVGNAQVKEAVVRVTWRDPSGVTRTESAASYFFET